MTRALRLSVTDIDQYRFYRSAEYQSLGPEDLASRLLHIQPASPAMLLGRRFEEWLESWLRSGEMSPGFVLDLDRDIDILEVAVHQKRCLKTYEVPGWSVTLSGRVDAIAEDGTVIDWKTTGKQINVENYMEAYQWRCYLDMIEADFFRYEVFQIRKDAVTDHAAIALQSYEGLQQDIETQIAAVTGAVEGLEKSGLVVVGDKGRLEPPEGSAKPVSGQAPPPAVGMQRTRYERAHLRRR